MPVAFLLGAPRSGTTLLRVMLAGHPRLFVPPEMILAPFTTMAERKARLTERFWEKGGLRRAIMEIEGCDADAAKAREASMDGWTIPDVYAWLTDRLGDRILVDKCPHLSASPDALERLDRWYPDARWLCIVRHPGSVTRSIENMPMAEVMLQGYAASTRDVWASANRIIHRHLAKIPDDRKATLRYEELVTDPQPSLQRACAALGVPFHPATLDPYEGDRMRDGPPGARAVGDPNMAGRGRIQPELATSWLDGFDASTVGPDTHALARELGYDLGALKAPPMRLASDAFGRLLDSARELEGQIRAGSDLDAAEGRRFILRMLAASTDLFVEEGDADRPRFHHAEGPTRKMFADNPDADYWRAPISFQGGQGREYTLTGRVPPGTTYVGVLLYGRGGRIGNRVSDVPVDVDGRFTLTIAERTGPGVLTASGDETAVFVRQYFHDRATQPPVALAIQLANPPETPGTLTPGDLTKGLERAERNLRSVFQRTVAAHQMAVSTALNRFVPIGGEALFPTPDNTYLVCWYRLGADQRLVVRGRLPKARYVSFTLYNLWMESLEYRDARVSLNDRQLQLEPDGSFELAITNGDQGHRNGLDHTGHLAGYLLARILLPEGDIPIPTVEVRYEREEPRH